MDQVAKASGHGARETVEVEGDIRECLELAQGGWQGTREVVPVPIGFFKANHVAKQIRKTAAKATKVAVEFY